MVIHKFIHSLWINRANLSPRGRCEAEMMPFRGCDVLCHLGYARTLTAILQHFSARRSRLSLVCESGVCSGIAGWRCRLRIYSRRSSEYFGVPVEEFNEAYLSAKSSQTSQDARLPQTHEFGWRAQGRRESPASGPQAPGSLTVATRQAHASD